MRLSDSTWQYDRVAFVVLLAAGAASAITRNPLWGIPVAVLGAITAILSLLIAADYRGLAARISDTTYVRSFPGKGRHREGVRWWRILGAGYVVVGLAGVVVGILELVH